MLDDMKADRAAYTALMRVRGKYASASAEYEAATRIYNAERNADAKPQSIKRMANRYKRHAPPSVRVSRPAHAWPHGDAAAQSVPRYDAYWKLSLDTCIVIGDVHVPTTNWQFAARVAQLAKAERVKTLCIIGDLFNFDAFSKYDHIVPGASLHEELSAARDLVNEWLNVFDNIYMTLGNHEDRLMRLHTSLDYTVLGGMIANDDRFHLSPYAHMEVVSGGQLWRLTHQRNYSKLKLRVANTLAAKHHCNIITHHQHHVAKGLDDSGKFAILDNGGLHDSRHMAYVQLVDSTSPRMTNSFVLLEGGTAHLLTPYDTLTNWSRYVDAAPYKVVGFPTDDVKEDAA